eukprot:1160992-Pelagomonas_calceolata.AAC.5
MWLESFYVLAVLKFIRLRTAGLTHQNLHCACSSAGWPHVAVAESPYVLAALKFIQLITASRTQHIRISIVHARLQGGLTWLWLESPYVLAALKFIQLSTASRTQHIRISITHARLSAGWPHMAVAGQPICPGCTQALPMGSPGKRRWRPFPGKAPALACDVP